MDEEVFRQIPKVELHCHLDGSLSIAFLKKIYSEVGISYEERMLINEVIAPRHCRNLTEYLNCFTLLTGALKTERALILSVLDVAKQACEENVVYLEIRFSPEYVSNEQLTLEQSVKAVIEGIKLAQEVYQIKIGLILCMMRGKSNQAILQLALDYRDRGVCGLDLAGNELKYGFPYADKQLFQIARSEHLPFTIHAGETGSIENVLAAVQLGAKRIGHGIALAKSKIALDFVRQNNVTLELCPRCNIQTRASECWENYPFQYFFQNAIQLTVNTDNRTVTNTTLTKEFLSLSEHFLLNKQLIYSLTENALNAAFISSELKQQLRIKMRDQFSEIELRGC